MVHGKNRIPYRIDRSLTGLAGPKYHAIISVGLPIEPEDSQYGESRLRNALRCYRRLLGEPPSAASPADTLPPPRHTTPVPDQPKPTARPPADSRVLYGIETIIEGYGDTT